MALPITITDAGRAEIINAQNTGTGPVTITEIGFGTGQYTPTKTRTALQAQVKRVGSVAGQAVAADTIHVMALDESASSYNVGEFGLFSDKGTLIAVYSQPAASGWIIQKAGPSTLLLATDIILESLDANSITFGDISFINPPATTTVQGVVELATPEETQTGTDGSRAVTPAGLKSLTGTISRAGLVQLNNSLTSTSTAQALTAAQGKKLQDEKQPADPTLTALAALVTAANKLIYATGVDKFATTDLTAFARALLDDVDAASARATLELVKQANPTDTTSGKVLTVGAYGWGRRPIVTDANAAPLGLSVMNLATAINVPEGLSGPGYLETDAESTFTSLMVQRLSAIAMGRTFIRTYAAGWSTWCEVFHTGNVSSFAQTLLDDLDAAAARATLGAQQQDETLTALANVVTAANKLIYATGPDTFSTTDLTAFARSFAASIDAETARAALALQTVSQDEAGAGTATNTRSWTAQRVRQAILAWWNSIKVPVEKITGLGTAATRNVGTGAGELIEKGAYGIGESSQGSNLNTLMSTSNFISTTSLSPSYPFMILVQAGEFSARSIGLAFGSQLGTARVIAWNKVTGSAEGSWDVRTSFDTTFDSNGFLRSGTTVTAGKQGVTADTQIIAGTGLTGGGNLGTNRTLSIDSGYIPVGVGQTWQDLKNNRVPGTTYTNTTGRPIYVGITTQNAAVGGNGAALVIDGIVVGRTVQVNGSDGYLGGLVPSGSTYSLQGAGTDPIGTIAWAELR